MSEYYIAIDCNQTGKKLEKLIFAKDLTKLKDFSQNMTAAINKLSDKIQTLGGEIIISAGDNILGLIDTEHIKSIVKQTNSITVDGNTFSIGMSSDIVGAYLALKYAKSSGNNSAIIYEDGEFSMYSPTHFSEQLTE